MTRGKRVPPRTAQGHTVITALRTAITALMRQFDADLQREHQLSHTEYVALDWLAEAPDRTLGLSDLAARCQQSLSAISRTVGRLETQGLVRRYLFDHLEGIGLDAFGDALQHIITAAGNRTTVPSSST